MSHGVHAVQHEVEHQIEHEGHGHGGGHNKSADASLSLNRKIALLIAVIALLLAICETMGKSAQTSGIELNIKASDTWNFFQAKTVRQTSLRTAAEAMTLQVAHAPNDQARDGDAGADRQWKATVARYDSDPKEQDGRKELRALAEKYERERDVAMARYHNYEFGSAAFQIGIVLASAAVITGDDGAGLRGDRARHRRAWLRGARPVRTSRARTKCCTGCSTCSLRAPPSIEPAISDSRRHGRACPGHPRFGDEKEDVDARPGGRA